jgi:regulator of sirC expression with transglutaminase-like and TPR domain
MLSNLFGIYSGSNDYARALRIVERILMIAPESATHIRDRGLLLAATGENARAAEELKRYLAMEPRATDAETIREQIAIARQAQARLN